MGAKNSFKKPLILVAVAAVLAAVGSYSEHTSTNDNFVTLGDLSSYKNTETNVGVGGIEVPSAIPQPDTHSQTVTESTPATSALSKMRTGVVPGYSVPTPRPKSETTYTPPAPVFVPPQEQQTPLPQTPTWWKPALSSKFHIQFLGTLDTKLPADIYVVDMLDTKISEIKQQGHKVVCYFSAGSKESWRPDAADFLPADLGKPMIGWAGESWLDIRSQNVRKIMLARMDLAKKEGCDGVDFDNVDEYTQQTGFPLTEQDQLEYDRFLAREAHTRGLAASLKNDVNHLSDLVGYFDLAINESCHVYNECSGYNVFTSAGKPVLNIEYEDRYVQNTNGAFDALCVASRAASTHTLVLPKLLDGTFRKSCD